MELFTHGQTVRLVGMGTSSQRRCLWVVQFDRMLGAGGRDWGFNSVQVHRQTDPDCIIWAPRSMITAATVLDLLANA
jgi:hypothetical protein